MSEPVKIAQIDISVSQTSLMEGNVYLVTSTELPGCGGAADSLYDALENFMENLRSASLDMLAINLLCASTPNTEEDGNE